MLQRGISHLGGLAFKAVIPYTPISSLMAWILKKVTLKIGRSSNKFSSIEALPDLLGDSDVSDKGVLEEESKA